MQLKNAIVCMAGAFLLSMTGIAQSTGVQAELRSSNVLIPGPDPGEVSPTAPAGSIVAGAQAWVCDAAAGFRPLVPLDNTTDPFLAIGTTSGIKLPISPTSTPASCGQTAAGNGSVYITQAVVDTTLTPSISRGVLRTALDPTTGALVGPSAYIATTAGLDGSQPTAASIGPDGNLYVGFLKSGDVKKIMNPGAGISQVVQKIGSTPSGHPARAFAFIGSDLYIASVDALSVIKNATGCTGSCNAAPVSDGFSGVIHTGIASDAVGTLYFAVANTFPGGSQIWRYVPSNGLYTFVSQSGADRAGTNASNFSFVSAKTDMLALDSTGNLWIGDDPSNGTVRGAGRIWTISAAALATLPAGSSIGGTNVATIFNVLRGPWFMGFITTNFTITFFADGTFTSVGPADSGTWTISPPVRVQFLGNPQCHLTFTDGQGVVLFSSDFLMTNLDTLVAVQPWVTNLGTPISGVLAKQTP
ncbi:MAG TPA: hypothetical protein VKU19_24620 [Bryobacteraceae bacterium]|nr:hypothetical protein [Bryobacteraceae bacterium]